MEFLGSPSYELSSQPHDMFIKQKTSEARGNLLQLLAEKGIILSNYLITLNL